MNNCSSSRGARRRHIVDAHRTDVLAHMCAAAAIDTMIGRAPQFVDAVRQPGTPNSWRGWSPTTWRWMLPIRVWRRRWRRRSIHRWSRVVIASSSVRARKRDTELRRFSRYRTARRSGWACTQLLGHGNTFGSGQRRTASMKGGGLLEGVADPHQQLLAEVATNELHAQGRSALREPGRQADGWAAREVERRGGGD